MPLLPGNPQDRRESWEICLQHSLAVTHCYERRTVPGRWEYTHYTVHHGYSRDEVLGQVRQVAEKIGCPDYTVLFSTREFKRVPNVRMRGERGRVMNRITQCMHGRGTVSGVMKHRHKPQADVPSTYLAFAGMYRPVVFWNLTDRCNLSCTHCYSKSGPGRTTEGELTTAEAFGVIDDLAAMGVPLILFTGGEPLMREDLWELARHARSRGLKMALSTNGTLITPEVARKIQECGIEYAGISLDGARAETHDRFRNSPGAFEKACSAFRGL